MAMHKKSVSGKAGMGYSKTSKGGGDAASNADFKTATKGAVGDGFGGMGDWGSNARVRTTSLPAGGCPANSKAKKFKGRLRSYA